ncbi:GAF domain-containing protein [Millisia brevis]|uniref:GAF domain-containing protein n=1 Tax=Millisia brevis TaxID=264148 RepID=UPI00082D662F|nr:GAF domain-containing protein [Millisia brevis]
MPDISPDRSGPEPAVASGDDPRHYARLLSAVYDAAMGGGRGPARPRTVISDSWGRARVAGVDPDAGAGDIGPVVTDLQARRQSSGLASILEHLVHGLDSVVADDNILVVADATGRVLWRNGANRVLHQADRLGFVEGADWAESAVGTNAIGTALASGRAVQVFSAEHYVRSHHSWTCAGAPILDPRTGAVLGVVDVSGPAETIHPTTVTLVDLVAQLATSRLRDAHHRSLDRLRAVAAPILARAAGPALAVDTEGWVAALDTVAPRERVTLPAGATPGRVRLAELGTCDLEPLPGGWLVRPVPDDRDPGSVRLSIDITDPGRPRVTVSGTAGRWTHDPSPRHAQILLLLARRTGGLRASDLSLELFGAADRTVTVRAEMSRLRKHIGGLIAAGPYRFVEGTEVVVVDQSANSRYQ